MKRALLIILTFITIGSYAQPFTTESQWENYFKKNIQKLDPIEGIWSNSNTTKLYNSYNNLIDTKYNPQVGRYAIYKTNGKYKAYLIGYDTENAAAELTFSKTASNGVYLVAP